MIKLSLCVVCMSQGLYVIRFSLEIRNCRCSFNSEWGRLWAPCVSNIWHAVVSRGAAPHCHRTLAFPASSREHNGQYTQHNHPSVRFPHSLPHLLWSFCDFFHLVWLSWFHSLLIFYIHLRPTGDVKLCQPRTHEAFIPDLVFCLQSATN